VHTISRRSPPAGMGTGDFITEVLDLDAVLDRSCEESLVDCFGRPGVQQRAVAMA
jgi:hypothetical protein